MSLTTRCPSCHTLFRVVQDQLRISDGWVRCGQCSEIFDAATALVDVDALANASRVPIVSTAASSEQPSGTSMGIAPDVPITAASAAEGQVAESMQYSAEHDPASVAHESIDVEIPFDDPVDPPVQSTPISPGFGAQDSRPEAPLGGAGAVGPGESAVDDSAKQANDPVPAPQVSDASGPADDIEPARPSFLREMPRRSPWHRGWVRSLLLVSAVALLAALGGQVAVQERDRLAAMFPQIRPALIWLCEQAGCVVGALRRIESVVIEGSSFNKTRGDNYRLSLVLKNTSALDIALPALELTLTDSQDQAVMRRVLLPSDLGATSALLKGGGEWSGNIALAVRSSGSADRFSGYRVLAFYP